MLNIENFSILQNIMKFPKIPQNIPSFAKHKNIKKHKKTWKHKRPKILSKQQIIMSLPVHLKDKPSLKCTQNSQNSTKFHKIHAVAFSIKIYVNTKWQEQAN